jgi:Flp pilus assembly pilin Flp
MENHLDLKGETTMNRIKNFFANESGLELTEYAVGAALIAVGAVIAFTLLGDNITAVINNLAGQIN